MVGVEADSLAGQMGRGNDLAAVIFAAVCVYAFPAAGRAAPGDHGDKLRVIDARLAPGQH